MMFFFLCHSQNDTVKLQQEQKKTRQELPNNNWKGNQYYFGLNEFCPSREHVKVNF